MPVRNWIVPALCASLALAASGQDLPAPGKLIDQYIEATGGKAAHEKIRTRIERGKLSIAGAGIEAKFTAHFKYPNLSATEVVFEALGPMREGFDGRHAWSWSTIQGPRIAEGAEHRFQERAAEFHPLLNWEKQFQGKTIGRETVNERPCYVVELTPKDGDHPQKFFFDVETHLLHKAEVIAPSPMGEIGVSAFFGDYRKAGDLLIAHKRTQEVDVQKIEIVIESTEHNADIPDKTFEMPEEVRELLKDKAAAGTPDP